MADHASASRLGLFGLQTRSAHAAARPAPATGGGGVITDGQADRSDTILGLNSTAGNCTEADFGRFDAAYLPARSGLTCSGLACNGLTCNGLTCNGLAKCGTTVHRSAA